MVARKFGWIREYADINDYTFAAPKIAPMARTLKMGKVKNGNTPTSVDLRKWCSEVKDQGGLGSCTANAATGAVEYYQNKAYGKHIDASRLFLYKATRNLMHMTGDTGAYIRSTVGALALFGAPPEEYCPYVEGNFDKEPTAFQYCFADDYKGLKYVRVSPTLQAIKSTLASQLPVIFGFTCYQSLMTPTTATNGKIPYPAKGEQVVGGHAILMVGYDDSVVITNPAGGEATQGAFLIRNSWGGNWGLGGYGWLPYKYAETGLSDDYWTLLKQSWVDSEQFGFNDH
jgi:C1A family cysteine protease